MTWKEREGMEIEAIYFPGSSNLIAILQSNATWISSIYFGS